MSSSSLRQHQRKSAVVSGGHSPLARNHSVGTSTHHHSSSTSFATQGSYRSLPSPATTTTTTTATANILHEDNHHRLDEKNASNIFNFDHPMTSFHNSSINQSINMPQSMRLLCGSIVPLQSSTSSPNIDQRSTENEQLVSPLFSSSSSSSPFQKPELKYRSHLLRFFSYFHRFRKSEQALSFLI